MSKAFRISAFERFEGAVPERTLVAAVMQRAFADAFGLPVCMPSKKGGKRRSLSLKAEARRWLHLYEKTIPNYDPDFKSDHFNFVTCCCYLDLDPELVHGLLRNPKTRKEIIRRIQDRWSKKKVNLVLK